MCIRPDRGAAVAELGLLVAALGVGVLSAALVLGHLLGSLLHGATALLPG